MTSTLATTRRPTRELPIFLAVTFGLTALSTVVAKQQGVDVTEPTGNTPLGTVALYGQAFWPLLGALAARLATAGTLAGADWGYRRVGWRTVAGAAGYGAAVPLLAALPLLLTGVLTVDPAGLADTYGLSPALGLLAALTIGTIPYVLLAIGEEIGWRGVLVPRLAETGSPSRLIGTGGLIWAAFHLPLMTVLGGTPDGVPVAAAAALFTVGIVAFGAVLAWMRLRWGLWPVVAAHAAYNAALYSVLEPGTARHGGAGWLDGETGIALAVVCTLAAAGWLRRAPLTRTPDGVEATVTSDQQQDLTDTGEMVVIHAMFRRQFGELPDLVRAVPEADRDRTAATSDHLRLLLDLLHNHHTAEDAVLWPLLEQRAPAAAAAIVAVMQDQHDAVDRLTGEVRAADAAWRDRPGPANRDRLAGLIEDLAVTLDVHLEAEERDVLPLAARTVSQAEWGRIGKAGGHRFTPRQMAVLLEMLTEAGDPVVVGRMKQEIPAPLRAVLGWWAPRVHRAHRRRLTGR